MTTKKRAGLTILAGLMGLTGLAFAGGTKQYTVTVTAGGSVSSAIVTIFICTDSICQSPTEIGTISLSSGGTVAQTFNGPSGAKAFSYQLSEVDNGLTSGANAMFSAHPLGVATSVGSDLQVTVNAGSGTGGTSTGGNKGH